MNSKKLKTQLLASLILCSLALFSCIRESTQKQPNVLIFFTDDQGTLDVNCYGASDLETPNMDRLAKSGILFTQAYAHTVCCPSRAALLTGRHPQRSGITHWTQGDRKGSDGKLRNMPLAEITLAEVLRDEGYETALFGKWHLGAKEGHGPLEQGFDTYFGHLSGFIDNYRHCFLHKHGYHDLYEGNEEIFRKNEYYPELMTEKALEYLDQRDEKPFFMMVSYNLPHYPEQPLGPYADSYPEMEMPRQSYARVVTSVDHLMGRILDRLEESGLRENTIIIMMSDNGHSTEDGAVIRYEDHVSGYPVGHYYHAFGGGGYTGKWIGGKGTFLEGGIRVPAVISFPPQLPEGETRDQVVTVMDWFPTILELAGIFRPDLKLDGKCMIPVIEDPASQSAHPVLHFGWARKWAVRKGEWKLLGSHDKKTDSISLQLLNLTGEKPEQRNWLEEKPELARQLGELHDAWVLEVSQGSYQPAETKKPNILFIMSDDHAAHAISAYGGRLAGVAPTPNIDRLASGGMRFTNAFVTNSICTPSRSVFWTGKYSHVNGVYKFTGLDQSQPTLPKYMQEHGYQTGFVGKYHLHTNPVGLDHWDILPGQGKYHDTEFVEMGDEDPSGVVGEGKTTPYSGWHSTDIITEKALDWFKIERDPGKPFFYMLHYKAPHDLWEHARRYDDYLTDTRIPEPANLFDHGSGRSAALDRSKQDIAGERPHTAFTDDIIAMPAGKKKRRYVYQEYIKRYLRCVKGIDDNVGRVLDYLEDAGLAENTIVIYTSDQGFFLGEHGLFDKRYMYEESLRIPLLVKWPTKISAGTVRDEMVLNLDFAPTILDLAGHPVPEDIQGYSFLPILLGESPENWRKSFYYRYYRSHFNTPAHFGIRSDRYKLICFDTMGEWELYDLKTDPEEMIDLSDNPEYARILSSLKTALSDLQRRVGDSIEDIGDNPRPGNSVLEKQYYERKQRSKSKSQ